MITELNSQAFYKCKALLAIDGQLEARAVVEGINPGRIFVDDVDQPSSGLVWLGNNDGFFFIGDEENLAFNQDIHIFIDQFIKPEASKVGLTWFEAIGDHAKWDGTIKKVFEQRKLMSWSQRIYRLSKAEYRPSDEPVLEPGYEVVPITKSLFENQDRAIHNIAFLNSKIVEFWSTPERFLQHGIGFCAVKNHEITSICFSGFAVGNVHCVAIETLEAHRGKKLAQMLTHRFVNACFQKESIAYWDCMETNKPSIAVAEKVGLHYIKHYQGFAFSL